MSDEMEYLPPYLTYANAQRGPHGELMRGRDARPYTVLHNLCRVDDNAVLSSEVFWAPVPDFCGGGQFWSPRVTIHRTRTANEWGALHCGVLPDDRAYNKATVAQLAEDLVDVRERGVSLRGNAAMKDYGYRILAQALLSYGGRLSRPGLFGTGYKDSAAHSVALAASKMTHLRMGGAYSMNNNVLWRLQPGERHRWHNEQAALDCGDSLVPRVEVTNMDYCEFGPFLNPNSGNQVYHYNIAFKVETVRNVALWDNEVDYLLKGGWKYIPRCGWRMG